MLMMRQVHFEGHGGPDVIRTGEAPVPEPGQGQVLIEVAAAGVNRPDCLQREGVYPPPAGESDIPGLEIAGRVVARGEGVSAPKEGDDICALVGSGGYAEYALAHALLCLPVPKALGVVAAAGIPENYFTVFDNVLSRGKLAPGETFLVHGGSSGIGSTAIQLAKQIRARVIATAGSSAKCAFCKTLGADFAIDYKTQDFAEEVKKIVGKHGVDVVLDMVGGTYLQRNLSVMAAEGRLVQIGSLAIGDGREFRFASNHAAPPDLDRLHVARAYRGTEVRGRHCLARKNLAAVGQGLGEAADPRDFPARTSASSA